MDGNLRKFGFSLGLGLNILGCVLFYRHKEYFIWFSMIGSIALTLGIMRPKALTPLKRLLDRIIAVIERLTSVTSLLIVFYLIFTPIRLLLKIFGKDLLNKKMDRASSSYWIERKQDIFSKQSYERMG